MTDTVLGRAYRALLVMYPRAFRKRFADALVLTFHDGLRAASAEGLAAVMRFVARSMLDVVVDAVAARVGRSVVIAPSTSMNRPSPTRHVPMDRLLHDTRFALRSLSRRPVFTTVIVLTLALGIGANSAIFSLVNAILLRPLSHPESGRLMTVWQDHTRRDGPAREWASPVNFTDWRDQNETFEGLAAWSGWGPTLTGDGPAVQLNGGRVTAGFFTVMQAEFAQGRGFAVEEDVTNGPRVIVLSHRFWQDQLAGVAAVGRTVTLGGEPFTVVGVLAPKFRFDFLPEADVWTPLQADPDRCGRACITVRVVGRLRDGTSESQARADLSAIARRLEQEYPEANAGVGITVVPLKEFLVGDARLPLIVLLASVGFVLLIACANVANLMLARATSREPEVAIRTALGAARGRLVQQLFTESFVLALVGGGLGLAVGSAGARILSRLVPSNVTLPGLDTVNLDGTVLAFTFVIALLTGLLFGTLPALHGSRPDLTVALKDGGRGQSGSRGGQRLRATLVVAEIAVAIVLLTGAGLFIRSLSTLVREDLGFEPANVLTASVSFATPAYQERERLRSAQREFLERVRAVPGVFGVAYTSTVPLSGNDGDVDFVIEGRAPPPPDQPQTAWFRRVTPAYARIMGMRLVEGRFIEERDRAGAAGAVVINETFARRYWSGESPLGAVIDIGVPFEVVGVVGNVRNFGLHQDEPPAFYISLVQFPTPFVSLVVKTDEMVGPIAPVVAAELERLDPMLALGAVSPLTDIVRQSVADRRMITVLIGVFATLAVLLAAIGIYGLMNYVVVQRTHELGIRITLGADRGSLFRLVIGQGLALALAGAAIGVTGAVGLSRLVASLLYNVSATDPVTLAAVPAMLFGVTLVALYVPARRAMRIEPVDALRAQ